MPLLHELSELRQRFLALCENDDLLPGPDEITSGLTTLLSHQSSPPDHDDLLLEALLQDLLPPLSALADHLQARLAPAPSSLPAGMEQFVETFRKDAEERLRALSISLMGVFGQKPNPEALTETTNHLHALRGSAAMLQLQDVADLTRQMETLLQSRRSLPPEERQWPTRTILRAFAILHEAIHEDPIAIIAEDLEEVRAALLASHSRSSPSPPPPPPASSSQPVEPPTQKEEEQPILIVDDSDTIAASVAFVLSELDVPLEIASHGEEALQLLREKPFSLVISDVDMPNMDGITLIRTIRADPTLTHLPLILLTSLDHPEERQIGLDAGATDYLIKGSIGGGELLEKVRTHLAQAPSFTPRSRQNSLKILVAEDTETVAASIAFLLSERPYEISIASDGREALKHLEKSRYDLLITDMQMPYMGGVELVSHLRANPLLSSLPVIMLTSVQDEEAIETALAAGVDRYLIKGEIAGGKLLSIVDEFLQEP